MAAKKKTKKTVEYIHEFKARGCEWEAHRDPYSRLASALKAAREAAREFPMNKQRVVCVTQQVVEVLS